MTEKRWKEIERKLENGDPLKDIGVIEDELISYIVNLRKEIKRLKDFEWKYKELCK